MTFAVIFLLRARAKAAGFSGVREARTFIVRRVLYFCVSCFAPLAARGEDFTAVAAETDNGYVHEKRADGTYAPEFYTLWNGGQEGATIADSSIDKMKFDDLAQPVVRTLAKQSYFPSRNHKEIKFLIAVYWGTTRAPATHLPFSEPELPSSVIAHSPSRSHGGHISFGGDDLSSPPPLLAGDNVGISKDDLRGRSEVAQDNESWQDAARVLGYNAPFKSRRVGGSDLDSDLLSRRYFVVLLAYDFQLKLTQGKNKLLWQARLSIPERGNAFNEQLPTMLAVASVYFGQNSGGLTHQSRPEGRVDFGPMQFPDLAPDLDDTFAVSGEEALSGPIAVTTSQLDSSVALAPDGVHVAFWRTAGKRARLAIVDIDQPQNSTFAHLSRFNVTASPLRWPDSSRVVLLRGETEIMAFSSAGKRLEPGLKSAGSVALKNGKNVPTDSLFSKVRAVVAEKFPNRNVSLISTDAAEKRFLFSAAQGGSRTRYFVFDLPNDLVFEIGQH